MKFYIDMDDTLGNFRDHAVACGVPPWEGTWYATDPATWTLEQHAIQKATNDLMEHESFWLTMPITKGAHEVLAAACSRAETFLLTAFPRTCSDIDMVIRAKKAWAERVLHFPASKVIVCARADKIQYAQGGFMDDDGTWNPRPNLLIDDAEKNCNEWTNAGGLALLYRHEIAEVIGAMKRLVS